MINNTMRIDIVQELLSGCTEECASDYRKIACKILSGYSVRSILNMPELNRWPETYVWIKNALTELDGTE